MNLQEMPYTENNIIPFWALYIWCEFSACLHIQEKCCEYKQNLHTVSFDLIKASVSQNISSVLLPKLGCNNHNNFIASLHTGMKFMLSITKIFFMLQQMKLKMVCI